MTASYPRLDPAQLANVPRELQQLPVWLHWRTEPTGGDKKPKKVPLYASGKPRTGKLDRPEDRAQLVTMERALAAFHDGLTGLGVALGRVPQLDDPLAGIDLDNCRAESGELGPAVGNVLRAAGDAYAEVSPSGSGIKLFGVGDIGRTATPELEIYSAARFFTVTGQRIHGAHLAPLHDAAAVARQVLTRHESPEAIDDDAPVLTGQRNHACFWHAVGLRDRGLEFEDAWQELRTFNASRCQPPLGERELQQLLRSAFKFSKEPVPVRTGELHLAIDGAVAALAKHAERLSLYVRGAALVRPYMATRESFSGADGAPAPVPVLEMGRVVPAALRADLMRVVQFRRPSKAEDKKSAVMDCPRDVVAALIESPDQWSGLSRIERIAQVPLFDGRQLHATAGLYRGTWIDAPAGVSVPAKLSRESAIAALRRVSEYLAEFPFASELDRAGAVALLLTAALRPSLATAPACCITKPVYGAGATTLAKLAGIVATGQLPPVINCNRSEEETDKLLGAEIMRGSGVLVLDNLREGEPARSSLLAQVLSDPRVTVRELGKSLNHNVECAALVILNGVNIAVGDDLVRRTFHVRLDPRCERPEAREYRRPNMLGDAQRERVALLSDLFTLTAAYLRAEAPTQSLPLAGFEQWLRWVVQPMVWLGRPDVVESVRLAAGSDPVTEQLRALLPLLDQLQRRPEHARFGGVTVADILMPVAEVNDRNTKGAQPGADWWQLRRRLHAVLAEATGAAREFRGQPQLNGKVIGRWLLRYAGRVVDGRRIVRGGEARSGQRWTIETIGPAGGQP